MAVMVQGLMERLLNAEELDRWFETARGRQYTKEVVFSALVELLLKVVCRIRPSVHAAYRDTELRSSIVAVYDKLKGLEPSTSQALVRHLAGESSALIEHRGGANPALLPGYRVKYLDRAADRGNSLEATQHRLKGLRETAAGALPGQCHTLGERAFSQRTDTGRVYEQPVGVTDAEGTHLELRRIVLELDRPTRDGETRVTVLTNLPRAQADAVKVAERYRGRWGIETAFQKLERHLHSEINPLGYPKAALFGFCLALVAFNLYAVVMAALRAAHPDRAINDAVSEYKKTPRGPRKPRPARQRFKREPHVATARVLAKADRA